ncbi:MAG: hypothetical protein E6Q66_10435 [Pedobacter sp.]|nr:MAG: hypothetical protein E6Q66_10435 [Pedobacter sp.]
MSKVILKKLNSQKIKREFLKFIVSFGILSFFSFMVLYFFVKTHDIQSANIHKDVVSYKQLLNKHQAIKEKVDSIYQQMSLLNTGKVRNDVFLGNYISNNIQDARKTIAQDSISEFKHYTFLLNKLDSLLALKNDIIEIKDKEQLALRDLNECVGKIGRIKKELSYNPARNFSSK